MKYIVKMASIEPEPTMLAALLVGLQMAKIFFVVCLLSYSYNSNRTKDGGQRWN
jgi:hypothetical protein